MTRHRPSAPLVISVAALVVALAGGGSALAASLVTGAQVRDRSLTGVDIAKNSLTGTEVKESTLAKVPAASRADLLGGHGAGSFARALRGSVAIGSLIGSQSRAIFTDPSTGIRVSYQNPARFVLHNINTAATVTAVGEGHFASTIFPETLAIGPGADALVIFDATGVVYVHLLLHKKVNPPSAGPLLSLTCMMDASSEPESASCVGVG